MAYESLRSILAEAAALEEEERRRTVDTCPECGRRLDVNSRGVRNCPAGHFRTGA